MVAAALAVAGCGSATLKPSDGGGTGGAGGPGGASGPGGKGGAAGAGGHTGGAAGTGAGGTGVDGGATDACPAETNAQFCTRLAKSCEMVSGTDNCGAARTANCGTCTTGMGCVDQVCQTPVCTTFNYSSTLYSAGSRTGLEDVAIAASNGGSIVYGQAPGTPTCGSFNVYVADETSSGSGTYTPRDLTSWVTTNAVINNEMAMSGDGLTLVVVSSDGTSLASAQRPGLQSIAFSAPSKTDFAAINDFLVGTTGVLGWPALSSDGHELYYALGGISTAVNGIYRSIRPTGTGPFPAGTLVTVLASPYQFVTSESSDRLTLFVYQPYGTYIFTRSSTRAEFATPNLPAAPTTVAGGWQHKVFQDCRTMFSMSSSGGCQNEDLYFDYRTN